MKILYDGEVASTFEAVDQIVRQIDQNIVQHCDRIGASTLFKINFMLREILNNAVEHGNHFDVDKTVHCRVEADREHVFFHITDQGSGVDLTCDPRSEECEFRLETRRRGLATVRKLNFDVVVNGNTVTIAFDLRQGEDGEKNSE